MEISGSDHRAFDVRYAPRRLRALHEVADGPEAEVDLVRSAETIIHPDSDDVLGEVAICKGEWRPGQGEVDII